MALFCFAGYIAHAKQKGLTMANINRGRLSITLEPCALREPGLQTLGTVTRKGQTLGFAVNQAGEYFAIGDGSPVQLPQFKVQSAIAALQTGIAPLSQAQRMQQGPKTGDTDD